MIRESLSFPRPLSKQAPFSVQPESTLTANLLDIIRVIRIRGVRAGLDRGRAISARFHRKNAKKRSFLSRPQNGSCRIVSSYLDEFSYKTQFKIKVNFGCNNSA